MMWSQKTSYTVENQQFIFHKKLKINEFGNLVGMLIIILNVYSTEVYIYSSCKRLRSLFFELIEIFQILQSS